jgi:hypothetical protein
MYALDGREATGKKRAENAPNIPLERIFPMIEIPPNVLTTLFQSFHKSIPEQ